MLKDQCFGPHQAQEWRGYSENRNERRNNECSFLGDDCSKCAEQDFGQN